MDEPLFSIGRFARVADLPASALRHYDEVGLLPAAHVDPVTGYRFYDRKQQDTARLLARLRELDVPIDEMRRLVALSGPALAQALEELATDQLHRTQRRVAALRELAREAAERGQASRTFLDPATLADALQRVSPLCGDAPFDAILILADADGVALFASDRYRLAALHCPPTRGAIGRDRAAPGVTGPSRAWVSRAEVTHVLALLERATDEVPLDVGRDGVRIAQTTLSGPSDDAVPDLVSVDAELTSEPTVRRLLERSEFESVHEELMITVGTARIHLTSALVREALSTLVAGPVLAEATSESRPVVLSSPARPRHHVIVMPRKH